MTQPRKGLGRGLSALIPSDDMDFLSQVARGEFSILEAKTTRTESGAPKVAQKTANRAKAPAKAGDKQAQIAKSATKSAILGARGADAKQSDPDLSGTTEAHSKTTAANQAKKRDVLQSSLEKAENPSLDEVTTPDAIQWLELSSITANPYQPRRHFDAAELQSLVESVREHGILQPIIVRPIADSHNSTVQFQLVAGERRWRAAQEAQIASIPAIIREVTDQQALELAVIENVQRHDITPVDAALAYRRLADEFSLSQERIAQRVGKSRSAIANTLRLLDLPVEIQQALNDGALSEGHGRAILLAEGEGARRAAFRKILRDKLSVREAEELARTILGDGQNDAGREASQGTARAVAAAEKDLANIELRHLSDELQRVLGSRVALKHRRRGGQIVINYSSVDEMNRIIEMLRKAGS